MSEVMKSLFINDGTVTVFLDKKKAALRDAKDYLSKEDYSYLDKETYILFRKFHNLHPKLMDYFEYQGNNLLDFVEEEFSIKSYFRPTLKDIVRTIGIVMKVYKVEKPYKVTVRDDITLKNRISLLVAKKMGLKQR